MKKSLLALAFFSMFAQAALVEVDTASELNQLIQSSESPVIVQFAAEWCGPCQVLKGTMRKVAQDYSDAQVRLVYVDADVNSSLKTYLKGGYPTVRTFRGGQLAQASFVGSKPEAYVRSFIDGVIQGEELGDMQDEVVDYCPVQ